MMIISLLSKKKKKAIAGARARHRERKRRRGEKKMRITEIASDTLVNKTVNKEKAIWKTLLFTAEDCDYTQRCPRSENQNTRYGEG
jgi:hypothetical protein